MDVDSKPAVITDGFYRANEAATTINPSQRIHTLFKSLLNSGTYATNWVAAKRGKGIPGIAVLVVIGCYWKWLVKCTTE
jgi:hypothetical protein